MKSNFEKQQQGKGNIGEQGGSTSDRAFRSVKDDLKTRGVPNSGGQMSNQTDNKQGNVNKGNQSPDVQGKNN